MAKPTSPSGDVTRLLAEIHGGNRTAEERLVPLVYDELRRLAAGCLCKERPGHTLQATALVHEAYLKLVPQKVSWQNRAHFLGIAAQQMRRILIDHARKQRAAKRECAENAVQLADALVMANEQPVELLALNDALNRLARERERQFRVVELRFFGGQTEDEIARILGISVETVRRDWKFAKAWLRLELRPGGLT